MNAQNKEPKKAIGIEINIPEKNAIFAFREVSPRKPSTNLARLILIKNAIP
ncbi:MAG: hypothetical protein PVJ67_03585 [Candidatus Pacearchaeota archaeon]